MTFVEFDYLLIRDLLYDACHISKSRGKFSLINYSSNFRQSLQKIQNAKFTKVKHGSIY